MDPLAIAARALAPRLIRETEEFLLQQLTKDALPQIVALAKVFRDSRGPRGHRSLRNRSDEYIFALAASVLGYDPGHVRDLLQTVGATGHKPL